MSLAEILFIICIFFTVYPYGIYPILVFAWSISINNKWQKSDIQPIISIIVSVYNEKEVMREKILNALSLDYPVDKLEIVVVSDGSTDGTNEIVSAFSDRRVVLRAFERIGKTACLNHVVSGVKGEIVVFTDANSMFPAQTLKKIVRNFSDKQIGLVTGWTKYRRPGSNEEEAPGVYARLEKFIKHHESLIWSCVGADGAIFAIRKQLYRHLEEYDINDFVIPLNVVGQKHRVVLDPDVYCLEEPAEGMEKEFRRQARITNRTLGAIKRNAEFLNLFRYRSFAFFLLTHKFLRFMVPFFFIGMIVTVSIELAITGGAFWWLVFVGLCIFIMIGMIGVLGIARSRGINLCAMFLLTCAAQIVGWRRFATGRVDTLWVPQR